MALDDALKMLIGQVTTMMDWTETSSSYTQPEEVHTNNCSSFAYTLHMIIQKVYFYISLFLQIIIEMKMYYVDIKK